MGEPTFTREELDAMARPFRDEFAEAVASGDEQRITDTFRRLEREYARFVEGFHAFVAAIAEWLLVTHGYRGLTALVAALFEAPAPGMRAAARREGDPIAAFAAMEDTMREVHDAAAGHVALSLSHVYTTYGVDALEACLRHCGDRTLLGWMPHDVARPAHERVRQWARMMRGNFATISVDETDDAFVITQHPCGTCSRQIEAGCYAEGGPFAVVTEPHAITWHRGNVPVYRTHVAVMHDLMPRERIGTSWPDIRCPDGLGTGPCRITLNKEPTASRPGESGAARP